MSDGPLLWYVNRGTGVVLVALLTLVTVLGVVGRHSRAGGRVPGFVVPALHRNLSVLCVGLLVVHASSAVADEYVDIRWWQAFAPWALSYRPWWLGLGTVGSDLILAAALSSAVRTRLGHRAWRAIHWTTYGAWALGVVHGLGTGTDVAEPWVRLLYVASLACVGLAILVRLAGHRMRTRGSQVAR
ncbi:MAG: methionine sulfoxide reductase heme-binding subunit [Nocardioidaceae bacterium]|jgi:sulfoxide reductase heme-binding subunit YedZ|nr:methionine sulfoxide reductase heme-binding subunit [Nocardioidaceae bacterium]